MYFSTDMFVPVNAWYAIEVRSVTSHPCRKTFMQLPSVDSKADPNFIGRIGTSRID